MTLVVVFFLVSGQTLSLARERLNAADFDGALESVDAGLKSTSKANERAELFLFRALCLVAKREFQDADRALESAFREDPLLTLGDLDVSPSFQGRFQEARRRLAVTVEFRTKPAGLGIRRDGIVIGRAPMREVVPVGAHRVEIVDSDGKVVESRDIVVAPGKQLTIEWPEQAPGPPPAPPPLGVAFASTRLNVDLSSPAVKVGASVEIGGGVVGRWYQVELDFLWSKSLGVGLRVGPRATFARMLGASLTADGAIFFEKQTALLVGATLGLFVQPLPFLELGLEGSLRRLWGAPDLRVGYGLVNAVARLRWPDAEAR